MYRITSICLTILFLGLMSASFAHAETYSYVGSFGFGYGTGNGQLANPSDVVVNSTGYVYVADTQNKRIQVFGSNYQYLKQWVSNSPAGIAVDSSDNVFVVNIQNDTIQKFDRNSKCTAQWGSYGHGNMQFFYPRDIAVDSSGKVYVADTQNNRIQVFDKNGMYLTQWGVPGSGNKQFNWPYDVVVNSTGYIYVADMQNKRIQVFDSNYQYLKQWVSNYPAGIAVDSFDNVFVVNSGNNTIQKFDRNSKCTAQWGSVGPGNGQFNTPKGIAVDSSGKVYVADVFNNRIQMFAREGKTTPKITWNNPADITYGTALSAIQLNAIASVAGTYKYTPAARTVLNAGTQTLHVDFTPTDTTNYNTASMDVTINVKSVSKKPVAAFSASPTTGKSPLKVTFTDQSANNPTSWSWNFGDKSTSTVQNPVHQYGGGKFTVTLTVSNAAGSSSVTKSNYIGSKFL